MKSLRQLLRFLEVCDGNLEEGSLRCDANVSVRTMGTAKLGTRTETQEHELVSFRRAGHRLRDSRQIAVIEAVARWCRRPGSGRSGQVTRVMRSKEEAHDYHYFRIRICEYSYCRASSLLR